MKIVFVSNMLNHHMMPLCEKLRELCDEFYFVVFSEVAQIGFQHSTHKDYVLYTKSAETRKKCMFHIDSADIAIYGGAPEEYMYERIRLGKLSFIYTERFFKKGLWRRFIPTTKKKMKGSVLQYADCNCYVLCASAYASQDLLLCDFPVSKCFKWGYFTKVDMNFKLEAPEPGASSSEITPLMWCARFLSWKHPELPVQLARRLKDKGYKFVLDMYGSGVEFERTQKLASDLDVCDVVNFCGVLPNDQILEQMKKHEIFLFTSDFNEGWGAVLNESMSCGCVPVASHAIGSVPFLIEDGINGLIYENENIDSLTEKVEFLLQHPETRFDMRQQAIKTMQEQWNAENAAMRFVELSQAIINDVDHPDLFNDGVCSKAEVVNNDWYKNKK